MKILAIDTSTASGSVALLDDARLVAEWTLRSAQTHNRRLLSTIDRLLLQAGWTLEDIDGIGVTRGPGSFTGVRIGLTTAKTLAWTSKKLYAAIPSLDALAVPFAFSRLPALCMIDAHKKEVYCALYRANPDGTLSAKSPYLVVPPDRVPELVEEPVIVCGDGWPLYRNILKPRLGDLAVEAPPSLHIIRAGFVGEIARRRFLSGLSEDPVTSVPLYVRPSEAELNNPGLNPILHEDPSNLWRAS